MIVTDDQARAALFQVNEDANASRRFTGTIVSVRARTVSVILDGEGTSPVTAYRGSYEPSIGAGVTVERVVGTTFYRVVGIRDTALGATSDLPFDFERQGVELYYPLALEAINEASYNVGDGLEITVYNVQYVDYDKEWHYIASDTVDLLSHVPTEDSRWVVLYADLNTDTIEVYAHTPTDTPEGGWLAAVNGLLTSMGGIVPFLAVRLDAGMTAWGDGWKVIKRGYSYTGKLIVRIPYYSPRDLSETVADASEVSFTPSNTSDWIVIPTELGGAANELASRLTDNEEAVEDILDLFPIGSIDVEPDLITGFDEITSLDSENDYILVFDATDGELKKVAIENVGGGSFSSPLTTKGDLLTHNGTIDVRAPVGANNETIIADSTETFGWRWATLPTPVTKTRRTETTLYLDTLATDSNPVIDNTDLLSGVGEYGDYDDLLIILRDVRADTAASNDTVAMYFNGDTTPTNYYSSQNYAGTGTGGDGSNSSRIAQVPAASTTDTTRVGIIHVRIPSPGGSNKKLALAEAFAYRHTDYYRLDYGIWWNNASVITSIGFNPVTAAKLLKAGTQIEIIGFKNETIGGGAENIRIALFTWEGVVGVGQHVVRIYNDYGSTRRLIKVSGYIGSAPTGSSILVDAFVNGTTVFTNQANRLSIASGTNNGSTTTIDAPEWESGEYLEVAIEQVGSTTPGSNLTVQVAFGEPL